MGREEERGHAGKKRHEVTEHGMQYVHASNRNFGETGEEKREGGGWE